MIKVTTNRIEFLLSEIAVKAGDMERKNELIAELAKHIPQQKRLTGLINNSYRLSVDELIIVSHVLKMDPRKIVNIEIDKEKSGK